MNNISHAKFPVDEVTRLPYPGYNVPGSISFSPDDKFITYLFSPQGDLTRQLYALDLESGETRLLLAPPDGGTKEDSLSLEEALVRERQRQRTLGVTSYAWAPGNGHLLIPLDNKLYLVDEQTGSRQLLIDGGTEPILDPRFSPDGQWVAYVQGVELHLVSTAGGARQQLTRGAKGAGKTHGLAEYIAQEEMNRSQGYWWSADSQWIAFTEVDETHIPVYRIMHQGKDWTGEGAQEDHRYPFAGQPNARVRLAVIPISGGEPVWMDLGNDDDIYLARVQWLPDGDLCAQIENRAQTRLELARFEPKSGRRTPILIEENDVWINLNDMFRPLKKDHPDYGLGFVWASERTGFRHLFLYNGDGHLVRPLTTGNWMVDELAGIDESNELVYFLGTRDGPTERHLYVAPFSGGDPRRLTKESGTHQVVLDHGFHHFVDTHHDLNKPPAITLRSLDDGAIVQTIYRHSDPRISELGLTPPQIVSLPNRSRVTLYGTIYRPAEEFGSGPFPTIVYVYGGPHEQLVTNSWRPVATMRAQYLCRLGFLVFALDNRGSSRRGLEFEGAIQHHLGQVEVQDQVDGVRWLVDQGLTDADRVGIYGSSYGGYLALMALSCAPETYKVAVASAPVTDWDGYDTHYTERYMGTPQENPEGYAASSVMEHVNKMEGHLLLIHGLIDENVHFRHTARLINALVKAGKSYDLLLFPDERHGPRRPQDRVYQEEQIRDYFLKYLA